MNERIKQLMLEAGYAAPEIAGRAQRLAELIVRDCAQVCLEQRDPGNLNFKPSEKFAEAVKQRFGIQ